MPSTDPDELITVRKAAERLGVHENTVRNWAKRGRLTPVRQPGSRYQRFRSGEVEELRRAEDSGRSASNPRRAAGKAELVDADFLAYWQGEEAKNLLPVALLRLLSGSHGLVGLDLRTGDGISFSGWDVQIGNAPGNQWIPAGPSYWEIGTGANPQSKAQSDYEKRTADPLGADPSVSTFVFVTQRRWAGAARWAEERRAEGVWRDVRVLDADHLGAWLAANPSAQVWLSEEVGLRPLDVSSIEDWWRRFSERTRPRMTAKLPLAGRAQAAESLRNLLQADQPTSPIGVEANSLIEARAFIAAAILDESELAQKTVVARSAVGWERLALAPPGLVLIPDTNEELDLSQAFARGHHVVTPVRPQEGTGFALIKLEPLDRILATEALEEEMDQEHGQAHRLAGLARRSFAAFMRVDGLAVAALARPAWARGEDAARLAPLTLLGAWTVAEGDLEVVANIAGVSWAELEPVLKRWGRTDDAPFVELPHEWRASSPEEAWSLLAPNLRDGDLDRFWEAVIAVLGEVDPALELSVAERPYAALRERRSKYSSTLRRGVAQGVALLGTTDNVAGPAFARQAVRTLLDSANGDASGLKWRGLSDQLNLLAEAAPRTFLDGLEDGLRGDNPPVAGLFEDHPEVSGFFSSGSSHTHLLWALETLAWSPDHLQPVVLALARLAELDEPEGSLGNRPKASLRSILLPWLPQTGSDLASRLHAIDAIREHHPAVAWQLLLALLPRGSDSSSSNSGPRFRDWPVNRDGVPLDQRLETIEHLVTCVINDAGADLGRWTDVIGKISYLPPSERARIFGALDTLDVAGASEELRTALWSKVVDEIGRHKAYADAQWSMEGEPLERLAVFAARIEPSDSILRHARLFDFHPELDGLRPTDDGFDAQLNAARRGAISDVLERQGFDGALRLAEESRLPIDVGYAVAAVAGDQVRDDALAELGQDGDRCLLALGWVQARSSDPSWLKTMQPALAGLSDRARADFLRATVLTEETIHLIDESPAAARAIYWRDVNPMIFRSPHLVYGVERLLEHGRAWAAIDLISINSHGDHGAGELTPELVAGVLDAAIENVNPEDRNHAVSAGYEVGLLLDYLEKSWGVEDERLALYEWQFFPLLEDGRRTPRALYRYLASEPDFFVELVTIVFRGEGEPRRDLTEEEQARVHHAMDVLDRWRQIPGHRDDGQVEGDQLREWVRRARAELADRKRAVIGDQQIGQLLSGSPPGQDGVWPAEPVRDLLEDMMSVEVERGLKIGKANARGVTSRAVYAGGDQERELAAGYRADANAVRARWRRIARVLDDLAERYEEEAKEEDARAALDASRD